MDIRFTRNKWRAHFLVGSLCFLMVFTSCENDMNEVKALTRSIDANIERGEEVEILYSEFGEVQVKIVAPVLIKKSGEGSYLEMPEHFNVYFYNDDREVESKLEADYGIKYKKEEKMIARGDVILINSKGEKLNGEELIWEQSKGKIYSDKFVKVTTADEVIYGNGFESNEDFSEYKVLKIKGVVQVDKSQFDK